MTIKELKEKIGADRFIKSSIIVGLILLTVICYLIKLKINIKWDMIATVLGFWGVIITIKESEKTRIKQNEYDYKQEKITDEQIEFKHVIKEKIDLLDFSFIIDDFIFVNLENYQEVNFKINEYIKQLRKIDTDILWFYSRGVILSDSEIYKLLQEINCIRNKYTEELRNYSNLLSKFTIIKLNQTYDKMELTGGISEAKKKEIAEFRKNNKNIEELFEEINKNQFPILNKLIEYRDKYIYGLYDKAQRVVEERDNLMKDKLKEIK